MWALMSEISQEITNKTPENCRFRHGHCDTVIRRPLSPEKFVYTRIFQVFPLDEIAGVKAGGSQDLKPIMLNQL